MNPNTFFKYNLDFPEKKIKEDKDVNVEDKFAEGGERFGRIIKGKKEGKWLSGDADFDQNGNVYAKGKIWREENFKDGLRDGVYKRFDNNGKVIYETTFKKGTGLWKEFHSNGKLYFEMYTKEGYFTDTLRLHDDNGKIVGKRLYKKDSLVYSEGLPCFPYRPESVPSD
ncbi:antitoxin component YwqK of YwqJK toxin-antitoxin module [Chryseobacterium sp. BIGb0232]|nr:antitoxin component YwqK of YwqJK toxin-antitoxin module [Chryseobacterium sp. BIGb0232]